MDKFKRKRIAIIGAGPTGMEAALYAGRLGHAVKLYDRDQPGAHLRDWGHVRLFTPWSMNASPLGIETLFEERTPPWEPDACPTGHELLEQYLLPLSRSDALKPNLRPGRNVLAVGRDRMDKLQPMGERRSAESLRMLIESDGRESIEYADVVIDCSGTYATPCRLGSGGIPAPGEREHGGMIDYRLRDFEKEADAFSGQRVLLVGGGYSAATAVVALSRSDLAHLTWATRTAQDSPMPVLDHDPLPERDRLGRNANALADGADPRVEWIPGAVVDRLWREGAGLLVELRIGAQRRRLEVDRVLAHVGFEPDGAIYRQLQVHECYASMGPIKLAATLLDGPADCLSQQSAGGEALQTPEPGFFILGSKSYGKQSKYLMRLGWDQIRDLFATISSDPDLDLYRDSRASAARMESRS